MKKKSLREWIKENRKEIDEAIKRVVPDCRIDDNERRLWILNSVLQAARDNVRQKEELIDKLIMQNMELEKQVADYRKQVENWVLLWNNTRM